MVAAARTGGDGALSGANATIFRERGIEVDEKPGLTPDQIDISLENNVLTVSGERKPEWSAEEGARLTWHLAERRYGKFSRSFVLPRDVDQERIAARFENGVLSIVVPKSDRSRRRRIAEGGAGPGHHAERGPGVRRRRW